MTDQEHARINDEFVRSLMELVARTPRCGFSHHTKAQRGCPLAPVAKVAYEGGNQEQVCAPHLLSVVEVWATVPDAASLRIERMPS